MNIPEWTYNIERTVYTDQIFSVIGRLLYRSSRFESYCKALSILMDLKTSENILENKENFNEFLERIQKRRLHSSIQKIDSFFKKNQSLKEILSLAKDARNSVAHDLTLGLEHIFVNTEKEKKLEKELRKLASQILTGEYLLISIISLMTKERTPPSDYVDKNLQWVLELE